MLRRMEATQCLERQISAPSGYLSALVICRDGRPAAAQKEQVQRVAEGQAVW